MSDSPTNAPTNDPIKTVVLRLLREAGALEDELVRHIPAAEREATGTPEAWSAKDFIANITLWKRLQTGKLQMAVRGEPLPEWTDDAVIDPLNDENYRTWQHRTWREVWGEERLHTDELIAQVERMSEAELTATAGELHHVDGGTLWPELLANGAWFPYHQLIDMCQRRGDGEGAARARETELTGYATLLDVLREVLGAAEQRAETAYNLGCLYARSAAPERALEPLAEAFALRPGLQAWAQHDGDLDALRGVAAYQALVADGDAATAKREISVDELHERLDSDAPPLVIDVRNPNEFAAGHVREAVNIPLGKLKRQLAQIPSDRLVVTYCNRHHPGISRGDQAANLLAEHGREARVLAGGYPGWEAAALPVEAKAKE